jgi:CheY-like chemotaxis protein
MAVKRVLSVGQCYADHLAITRTLEEHFSAEITAADDAEEALARLREVSFDLVLVNRIFDRDGSEGTALIKAMKSDDALKKIPVMLVSNYEDSQNEAVAAGATPGFGKAALGQPGMVERVRKVLE